jgi:catechol 2,3-dioxygenase-like lactoylglutathione lyase family enzyme
MLGHLSFGVRDLERTTRFYDTALAPLGHVRVWTSERGVGYGETEGEERLTLFVRADAGAPGLRPRYGATYYAAFVVDPNGHKLEAVHQ